MAMKIQWCFCDLNEARQFESISNETHWHASCALTQQLNLEVMAAIETKLPGFYTSTMGETQSWEESWRPSGWVVNAYICLLCWLRLSNVLYNLRCMTMATIHPQHQKPLIYLEHDWRWSSRVIIYYFKRCIAMFELCKWHLTPRWGTDTYPMHNDQLSYVLGRKGSTRQKLARASGTWDATFWHVWHGSWYSNALPVDPEDRWYLTNLDENHQPKSSGSVKTSCFCFLPADWVDSMCSWSCFL